MTELRNSGSDPGGESLLQRRRGLIDAWTVEDGAQLACDLCIVGAGPAGIAIADRLRDSGLSIILLESGGFHPDLWTQRLFRGQNVGRPYFRLDACRFRVFGGSTNRWGGWCRPLEPVDYLKRSWFPFSGWPIDSAEVDAYRADTAKLFELTDDRFDLASWSDRLPRPFDLSGSDFESIVFQYSPETNFGELYRTRLFDAPTLRTLVRANLTGIELEPGTNRVGLLRVATLTGRRFTVRPRAVVLAAGGIENARLLLASRTDRPAGLGNEHDLVGRYFMEHLHVPVGHLLVNDRLADRAFYRKAAYGGIIVRGVLSPSAAAQERRQLLSTSIAIEPASYSFGTPYIGWPPPVTFGPIYTYRKLRGGRLRPVGMALKRAAERLYGLPMRWDTWNASRAARRRTPEAGAWRRTYSVYFRSEQIPDPDSRVMLSERTDALGVPEIRVRWKVNRFDLESITGWLRALDADVQARGAGRIVEPLEGWERKIIGGPHHLGTTRMSARPSDGVVDADCRVHSVDNLYIAGSSVFATGGYANPTFTLVALALRLADTLRARLRE